MGLLARLFPPEPPPEPPSAGFTLDEYLALRRVTEDTAARLNDLRERFDRFQNREGMRRARSDRDLANEAAEILAKSPQDASAAPYQPQDKQSLRQALLARRRH